MKNICILLALATGPLAGAQTIVWDQGPGTGHIRFSNQPDSYQGENFVDSVRFSSQTVVDTYYHYDDNGGTNQDIAVSLYADNAGQPGSLIQFGNVTSSGEHIVGVDDNGLNVYEHMLAFHASPITLLANQTYWIGASYVEGGLHGGVGTTIRSPGDGRCAVMNQQSFGSFVSDHDNGGGDLMFRLESPVPEPGPLVGLGLGIFTLAYRRNKANGR